MFNNDNTCMFNNDNTCMFNNDNTCMFNNDNTIGITHVFSCINICRVLRMLFEHEAVRPSVQTSSEGPGKC